ncbi:zinc finger BED domain-containing protein RICESLEEPER 2-like protein, partial [Tanacetum coccineum]
MYQAHVRKLLVQEVITDELPLSSLEHKGLHEFMKAVCPTVQIPSHETILSDCVQLFLDEKLKLKSFIKNVNQRVCITLDTWTPNQYVNYLCVIAHFIDNDWDKHKKILSFAPILSDDGEEIGKVVEKCLHDWEIDNVLTISAGNSSSNDAVISYLKERLTNTVLDGRFLHSRCLIDVLNTMVKVVLNEYDDSFERVRAAVLYVRQSSARTNNFRTCAEESGIDFNHFMCLDFPNKWICTFGMLFTSENYEEAFNMFEIKDPRYRNYMQKTCGVPGHDDWENARDISYILRDCICLAEDMFKFATSNKYFVNLSRIDYKFQKLAKSADTKTMALKMREKYNKYWGNMKELNMFTCVASVLDPTYKMSFIEYYFMYVYNQEDIYDGNEEDDSDGDDEDDVDDNDDDNDDVV